MDNMFRRPQTITVAHVVTVSFIMIKVVALAPFYIFLHNTIVFFFRMKLWGLPKDDTALFVLLCLMRVPGIIGLDFWYTECLPHSLPESLSLSALSAVSVYWAILAASLTVLLVPMSDLVALYQHVIAASLMGLSFLIAEQFFRDELQAVQGPKPGMMFTPDFYRRHLCPVASYVTLTSLVAWCLDIQHPVLRKLFPSLYIVPIVLRVLGLPIGLLATATKCVNGFFVFVIMDYCLIRLFSVYRYLMEASIVNRAEVM